MSQRISIIGSIAAIALVLSGPASAEEVTDPNAPADPNAPTIYSIYGTSVSIGGGVFTFADDAMRDFADTGGVWELRGVFGTRRNVAFEGAYTGAAQDVNALGLDNDAYLLSTGFEGLVRYNFMITGFQPYLAGGVGWRRYDIMNEDFNTSSINSDDDVLEIPLAAGVSYRYRGLVVDARSMVHLAYFEDLVEAPEPGQDDDNADLHTWSGQVSVGFEF